MPNVGIVLVSHSAKLAEGIVELAREMAGPDVPLAAAGGLAADDGALGTDAERIHHAIQAVYSEAGVLVLMDLGSSLLSADMAVDLGPPEWASKVLLGDAPLVEGAVAAVVQSRLGSPLDEVAAAARRALDPKIAQLGESMPAATSAPPSESTGAAGSSAAFRFVLQDPHGLHARPAARLIDAAARFQSDVQVRNLTTGAGPTSARSLVGLTTLGVLVGHTIEVTAAGPDAEAAIGAIREVVERDLTSEVSSPPSMEGELERPDRAPLPRSRGGIGEGGFGPAALLGRTEMDADRLATPLHGIPASPGVARGCLHLVPTEPGPIVEAPGDPNREWHRLVAALDQAGEELDRLSEDLAREGPSESAEIVATQRRYLDDPEVLATARASIFAERLGAAAAWWRATEAAAARYEQIDDPYLRERSADLPEVNRRISRLLSGGEEAGPLGSESMIFVGAEMGPAEVAGLDRSVVRGICLAHGGPTSHAAILARGLGIPVVLGRRLLELPTGTPLLVDGATGLVWPNPEPPILERYAGQLTASPAPSVPSAPVDRAPGPTRARDGLAIAVLANVGSLAEARTAATAGAEGVGLLRTEFLFLGRSEPPSEDEQVAAYRDIVEALSGRPVTIRTLDAGGDKSLPYLHLDPEVNPFLGRRSIRLSLARPDLFAIQLRAILRVAAATPVRVMFPLIATLAELQEARAFLDECLNQLREQGLAIPGAPDVGMMVEVPAAALLADEFSMAVDFLSIGTNDLAQYTLAADRGNPSVAALADPFHPAVLQLIAQTVRAARVHSKASSVCGEMAADPLAIPLLVGLGVDALSVAPAAIPSVRQTIAEVESSKARTLAERALRLGTADAVRDLLKTANQREGRQDGPTA